MEKRCVFLSMPGPLPGHCDDSIAEEHLRSRGWIVDVVPWQDLTHDFTQYRLAVIRSTWDYFDYKEKFLIHLTEIDKQVPLFNPLKLVKWNLEKTYLRELSEQNIETVPTVWMDTYKEEIVASSFDKFETDCLVVKPSVSGGSKDTYLVQRSSFEEISSTLGRDFEGRRAMIQPFLDSIRDTGEYSLFFFGGEFSHCVLKRPRSGDFRVQEEFGGDIKKVEPASELKEVAIRVVDNIPYEALYIRVDLVKWQNQWVLIELELIEPSLYFRFDEYSAGRFADALENIVVKPT